MRAAAGKGGKRVARGEEASRASGVAPIFTSAGALQYDQSKVVQRSGARAAVANTTRCGYNSDRRFYRRTRMARPKSLPSMSLEALVKLRDEITKILTRRAIAIQEQLSILTAGASGKNGGATLRRGKVIPKNRRAKSSARSRGGNRQRQTAAAAPARAGKRVKKTAERNANSAKAKLKGSTKQAKAGKPAAKQVARVEPKPVDMAAAQASSPQSSSEV